MLSTCVVIRGSIRPIQLEHVSGAVTPLMTSMRSSLCPAVTCSTSGACRWHGSLGNAYPIRYCFEPLQGDGRSDILRQPPAATLTLVCSESVHVKTTDALTIQQAAGSISPAIEGLFNCYNFCSCAGLCLTLTPKLANEARIATCCCVACRMKLLLLSCG